MRSLFQALGLILAYLSLEPLLRRLWPTLLVSWSRLVQGRWRDPLIGRDLLIAFAGSGINKLLHGINHAVADRLSPGLMPTADQLPFFGAPRLMFAMYGEFFLTATWMCLFYLMVFILLLKVICRRTLIAYLACIGVFFVLQLTDGDTSPLQRVSTFISVVLPITVLMRSGIFAAVAYFLPLCRWARSTPMTCRCGMPIRPGFRASYLSPPSAAGRVTRWLGGRCFHGGNSPCNRLRKKERQRTPVGLSGL